MPCFARLGHILSILGHTKKVHVLRVTFKQMQHCYFLRQRKYTKANTLVEGSTSNPPTWDIWGHGTDQICTHFTPLTQSFSKPQPITMYDIPRYSYRMSGAFFPKQSAPILTSGCDELFYSQKTHTLCVLPWDRLKLSSNSSGVTTT